jgi:DnaJ-class molecular chaperone
MASSKKVKRIHICETCKGNGYVKIHNIQDVELHIHQCWDCDSEGQFVEYVEKEERILN